MVEDAMVENSKMEGREKGDRKNQKNGERKWRKRK